MYMRMAAGSPLVGRRWPFLVRWCSVIVPTDGSLAEVSALWQARRGDRASPAHAVSLLFSPLPTAPWKLLRIEELGWIDCLQDASALPRLIL